MANQVSWVEKVFGRIAAMFNGSAFPSRAFFNFIGSGFSVADNPSKNSIDITINTLSAPTGTGFVHSTSGGVDAAAKLVQNADVESAAAIAGSKINPAFGSQPLTAGAAQLASLKVTGLSGSGAGVATVDNAGNIGFSNSIGSPALYTPGNAGHAVTETKGEVYVGHSGLTGDVTDTLPTAPESLKVTFADEDNSLASHDIIIDGGTKHIRIGGVDQGTTYHMSAGNRPGVGGALTLQHQGTFWRDV